MRSDDDVLVIDLGDERWSADDLPRPRRRYRHARRIALLAMVAALLPLAGSGRPMPLIAAPLWVSEEPGVVLGEQVYTFSNTGRLTARSLRDGAILWQVNGDTPNAHVAELNSGLLGYVTWGSEPVAIGDRHFLRMTTRVVDPDDGRVLATVPGSPYGRAPDDSVTVFATMIDDLDRGCDEWSQCLDLRGVDARTGAVVWQLPYQADREPVWSFLDGVLDSVGLVDARGQLVLHDPATGRPVRDVAIPFWPDDVDVTSPAQLMQIGMISIQDGALIGVREKLGPRGWTVEVSSFDLDTGRSWSTAFAAADSGFRYPNRCGRWICVADQRQAIVLDRDTGVEVARVDGYATELGHSDLLGVWRFDEGSPDAGRVGVFDPVAGVNRAVIPGSAQSVTGRPDLLVVSARGEARGSDVYLIDRGGRAHVVMTMEPAEHCQALREYLVCGRIDLTHDETLSLVRLRVFQLAPAAMPSAS